MSSSSATTPSPQEPASAVSSRAGTPPSSAHLDPRKAVLCEVEPVEFKSLQDEIRAHKDLTAFAEEASVVLDVRAGGPGDIVDALLARLVEEDRLPAEAVASARKGLLGREPVLAGERVVKAGSRDNENDGAAAGEVLPQPAVSGGGGGGGGGDGEVRGKSHWHRHIQGPGFIVPFARIAELDAVNERVVAIARLREPCRLGVVEGGLTQFVVAVLTPAKDMKDLKGPFELGRSFASLLQDDEFYAEARKVGGEEGFREAMRSFLERNRGIEEGAAAAGGMRKRKGGFGRKNAGDGDGDGEGEKAVDSGESSMEVPRESDEKPSDAVFARTGRFAGGLIDDIRRRYKWSVYKSDWTDGIGDGPSMLKYLSTIVWLYFAIIMPTIAFGALDDEHTNGAIGVIETLVSQAAAGLVFASFAGQPLTIVMTTAPLTVFIEVLFSWSKSLKIPFLPFYAWTGIWTAAILIVLVLTDSVAIMKYCGHFTEEIFAMLIAALFVGEYGKKLVDIARKEETEVFLLAFILATGTYLIAHWLLVFKRSFLLKPIIRLLLSDFGVPIAILIMSGVRQAFKGVKAEMLAVPAEIGIVTTNGRPWLVPLFDISIQYIFLAGVAGVLLAMLFFVSISMLANFERRHAALADDGAPMSTYWNGLLTLASMTRVFVYFRLRSLIKISARSLYAVLRIG